MSIKVPTDFDYKSIPLDPLESKVRDNLNVNISSWAKFRHAIKLGLDTSSLKSTSAISSQIEDCYLELGKSHYEAITMLGATRMSLDNVANSIKVDGLLFKKSFKEFYMHAGSVLDNIARIIFIINIPNAPTLSDRYGNFKRHSIGYGSLNTLYTQNTSHLQGYSKFIKSLAINEIKTLRNNFTHGWPPTIFISSNNGNPFWPVAMRKKEQYYLWPHDPKEQKKVNRQYRKKESIEIMIRNDWDELEKHQNAIFTRIIKDIKKFESNHNLIIQ